MGKLFWQKKRDPKSESSPLLNQSYAGTSADEASPRYVFTKGTYFYEFHRNDFQDVCFSWKIHISIAVPDIVKAWNKVIFPLLSTSNVTAFKIVKPESLGQLESVDNQGKVVTVYLYANPEFKVDGVQHAQFCQLLAALESGLQRQNIQPGAAPSGDAAVTGSHGYLHYRYEGYKYQGTTVNEGVRQDHYTYMAPEVARALVAADPSKPIHNPLRFPDEFELEQLNLQELVDQRKTCMPCLR